MAYNFETASGDLYFGNQLIPGGAPYADKFLYGYQNLPEIAYPKPDPLAGYNIKPFTDFATDVYNIPGSINKAASGFGNFFTGAGVGLGAIGIGTGILTVLGPAVLLYAGYKVAKKQKWI